MKKLLLTTLCICTGITFAQQPGKNDTTTIELGSRTLQIISDSTGKLMKIEGGAGEATTNETQPKGEKKESNKNVDTRFIGLDLGVNFITHEGNLNLPEGVDNLDIKIDNSSHVNLRFLPARINLIRHKLNLLTAIGLDYNDFSFSKDIVMLPEQDSLSLSIDTAISYKKSKLKTTYLQIPLMLNFQTNPGKNKKNFRISLGGYAGVLLGSKTKRKSKEEGVVKLKGDYNLERFRYGITGRIGYGGLEFYCNYNLSDLFVSGEGPQITQISVGITLMGWNK